VEKVKICKRKPNRNYESQGELVSTINTQLEKLWNDMQDLLIIQKKGYELLKNLVENVNEWNLIEKQNGTNEIKETLMGIRNKPGISYEKDLEI
jgi:predicted aldo/keto reductase-like oxidoreductase